MLAASGNFRYSDARFCKREWFTKVCATLNVKDAVDMKLAMTLSRLECVLPNVSFVICSRDAMAYELQASFCNREIYVIHNLEHLDRKEREYAVTKIGKWRQSNHCAYPASFRGAVLTIMQLGLYLKTHYT